MDDLDLGQTIRGFTAGQKLFGRYTLARILGRGGMGVVWLARDGQLEVDVALKFLPELLALDPGAIDDMKRETRRSRELAHRNIVKVYHFESDNQLAAISMEHVDGASLAKLKVDQTGKCFSHTQLEPWLPQMADALDYAHEDAKMVHRDLKPANLMLDIRGRIKITDFGIASSIADSASQLSAGRSSSGTPPYMSPQQAAGQTAGPLDDIYSLGATIYDLLTGKPPFHCGNIHHQIENVVPPPMGERRTALRNAGEPIPERWEQTIAACLSKNPAARPKAASEVVGELGLIPIIARRTSARSTHIEPATPSKRGTSALRLLPSADRRVVVALAGCLLLAAIGYLVVLLQRSNPTETGAAGRLAVTESPGTSTPASSPIGGATSPIREPSPSPAIKSTPLATPTASITIDTKPTGAIATVEDEKKKTAAALNSMAAENLRIKEAPMNASNEVAVIKTSEGEMVVEFWNDASTKTIENFKKLARSGFYDGTIFHRIIKNFMIQGGDPLSKDPGKEARYGTGGPGYRIQAEFNDHGHARGVLSMAREPDPNSAGSQFFICLGPIPRLDHQYTTFGKLIKGDDVLGKIGGTEVTRNSAGGEESKPTKRVVVESIKIVPADSIK